MMTGSHIERVDLNMLVALDALLGEAHVTRAAARLGLTQPAMSRALSRARALFDDPLLVRTGRGMRLTPRAERLGPALRRALGELQAVLGDRPQFEPHTSTRSFTLVMADYGQAVLLAPLLERLAREAPRIDLVIQPFERNPLGALDAGEVDLVITTRSAAAPSIVWTPLFSDRLVCLVRQGHPSIGRRLTAEQLAAAPQVLIAPEGRPGGILDEALAELGLRRRVALRVPSFLVAPELVATSDLVLTLPARIARKAQAHLPVRAVELPFKVEGFTMAQAWHERMRKDPAHAWLRGVIAAVGRELKRKEE